MIELPKILSFPVTLFTKRRSHVVTINNPTDLAHHLHTTRIARGITPTQVSRQTSISRENVYRIERGENITLNTLFEYCQLVGISIRLEIPPLDQENIT